MRRAKLYIDQYGLKVWARTVRELCAQLDYARGTARRMYVEERTTGKSYHAGYVVGRHWFTEFTPTRRKVS